MKSDFQFKEHGIFRLHIDSNSSESRGEEALSYFSKYECHREENTWRGTIVMGFTEPADQEGASPLYEIIIFGQFEAPVNETETEEVFVKQLKINGGSTLIPIARAALVSTCALMGWPGKYTLPNINVFALEWDELV